MVKIGKSVSFSQFVAHRYAGLKSKSKSVDQRKRIIYFLCFLLFLLTISLTIGLIIRLNSNDDSSDKSSVNNDSVDKCLNCRPTPTLTVPPTEMPTVNDLFNKFNKECLQSHNNYRSIHSVQPLSLDLELIKVAEKRAQELISTDNFNHPDYEFKYGENLHYIMPYIRNYSCPKVVKPWYDEIKDYDFSDWRKSKGKIGHFTQVVWKSTERVGCAQRYSDRSKRLYTVCNYSPPGNYINRYEQNVLIPVRI